MKTIEDLINYWNSDEGKPYKGKLIDMIAHEKDPSNMGCMCAQGQVLHAIDGWDSERLNSSSQRKADVAVAKALNISVAHSVLLRNTNDSVDGAPSIVITNPSLVLGDQSDKILSFWLHLDQMSDADRVVVWDAGAWDASGDDDWDAAKAAAGAAARAAAGAVAKAAAIAAAWGAAKVVAGAVAGASSEIQGGKILSNKGKEFFFLKFFGFNSPDDIPPLPDNYGLRQHHKGDV